MVSMRNRHRVGVVIMVYVLGYLRKTGGAREATPASLERQEKSLSPPKKILQEN